MAPGRPPVELWPPAAPPAFPEEQVLGEEKMQGTMGGEMVETGGNLASRERKEESLKWEGVEHDQQRPKSESRGEEREGLRAKEAISFTRRRAAASR